MHREKESRRQGYLFTQTFTNTYTITHTYLHFYKTTLTCSTLDAPLRAGHGEDGQAVIILGAACLDGTHIAMAACTKAAGQIQGLHGLRLCLSKYALTHWLELAIKRVPYLPIYRYSEGKVMLTCTSLTPSALNCMNYKIKTKKLYSLSPSSPRKEKHGRGHLSCFSKVMNDYKCRHKKRK